MSIDQVTSDPLLFYTLATAVTVVLTMALLAVLRLPGAWVPLRTWFVILPVALGAMWLGHGAWTLFVTVISIVAFKEFAKVTGLYRQTLFVLVVYGAIIAANLFAFIGRYDFFMAVPTWAILSLALVPILLRRSEGMLQWFALAIVGVVFYGYFLAHLSYLYGSPAGLGLLLFVVLMTQLNDALQYIYGKAVGRHHWTPISPNKTVEGSLLAGGTIVVLTFLQAWIVFPHVPPQGVLIAGLIIAIGGQIGDLTMANVKRNAGVKDFGAILPGHGGLTDRLNSLMVTAPAFAHIMGYLYGGFPT
ncbi:MAG: phosphatidate cytidylyltransferase [Chloroflexota bacterium]|nr:phosphatidate cytidylyltransferase [Chloroflexota bacterium]